MAGAAARGEAEVSLAHAKLYRKAAEIIDRRAKFGCCVAIDSSAVHDLAAWHDMRRAFMAWFKPDASCHSYWWADDEIQPRVLALCFMAAMAEAGDL